MSKSHNFRVACIQMTTGTRISENLSVLENRLHEAKEKGADLIVTPEQTLLMAKNKDSLFENIFPRFSYRYKYSDNQYSALAPFTVAPTFS